MLPLHLGEPPLVAEQGEQGAVVAPGQHLDRALTRRHDGALLALFGDKWRLAQVQREHPDIRLEPLIAG